MVTSKKDRRNSGRVYNTEYDPEKGAYNDYKWSDWIDHRDGMRNKDRDKTKSIKAKKRSIIKRNIYKENL